MEKLHVSLVIEILGRPPESLKEALQSLVTRLGAEKGVKVLSKNYHEPREIENSKDLFTTFVEVEAELDSLSNYLGIIFAFMPSHIELIKPEKITLSNNEMNELANALAQRLHNYDAVAKNSVAERDFVLMKLKEAAPEVFEKITIQKPKAGSSPQK